MTTPINDQHAPKQRKSAWQRFLFFFQLSLLLLLMGGLFAGGTAVGYVASLVKDDPVRSNEEIREKVFANDLTGFAYFRDHTLIGQLRAEEDRRLVKKDEVSPHLINAIIATEDKHFYEHRGIDPKGLIRAVFQSFTGSAVQTGGSTLTQQLIKQTILTPQVSHERKAKEIFLALRLERMFSKDQILEAYMNEMFFGKNAGNANIYGVQAAAKGIFGVDADQLNLPQAAYIAGMLQAPSRYIPFHKDGLEAGRKRQKVVLERMLENGYITRRQYREALNYDIEQNLARPKDQAYSQYPFLMMEIEERAARILTDQEIERDPIRNKETMSRQEYLELLEAKRKEVLRGGYHIYTTIDKNIYQMMTAIAEDPGNFGPNRSYKVTSGSSTKEVSNALEEVGATLIDNKTGAILGFIGGRDFRVQQVNHSTRPRQPGSAMKPLAAYAPAFELGLLQPGAAIDDAPIALENGTGSPPHYPANWNHRFQGLVTVREALKWSYNIPAIKAYLDVGIPQALEYVEKMGITTLITPKDNPSHHDFQAKTGVIGGLTQGLTVEEITNAYSTFPNQGAFMDAYLIEKIENSEGETIYEHAISPRNVFSEQTAYLLTDMMRTVVQSGTAAPLQRMIKGKRDIAGKTGTTNDDVDSWFVGFSPEVTLGVWIGYDIPHPLTKSKSPRSLQIWAKIMNGLTEIDPLRFPADSRFVKPAGIVSREVCRVSGKIPSELCKEEGTVVTDIFNSKFVPTETCDVHVKSRVIFFNGTAYLAKPETPDDMVEHKIGLKTAEPIPLPKNAKEYKMSFKTLDWHKRLPFQTDPRQEDGRTPSTPQGVRINGSNQLVWKANPEEDIAGYRIYRSVIGSPFEPIHSLLQSREKVFVPDEPGLYYVTAVDIAGKESAPSLTVMFEQEGSTGRLEAEPTEPNGAPEQPVADPLIDPTLPVKPAPVPSPGIPLTPPFSE